MEEITVLIARVDPVAKVQMARQQISCHTIACGEQEVSRDASGIKPHTFNIEDFVGGTAEMQKKMAHRSSRKGGSSRLSVAGSPPQKAGNL